MSNNPQDGYSITDYYQQTNQNTALNSFSYSNYAISNQSTSPIITGSGSLSGATLSVKGDAEFEGDVKWKGRSLEELFSKIEDRLAILQPDPKKLEKYEALRKAYDHYKTLERLIGND